MKKDDCIFCKVVAGELPAQVITENHLCMAIRPIDPKTKNHLLILIKDHVKDLSCTHVSYRDAWGEKMLMAGKLGPPNGHRVIINTGKDSGGTIEHLHMHVLGGENLGAMI